MTKPYQVKGSTIRTKYDFVEQRFGKQARERLERDFAHLVPLLTASWYPYDDYVAVLEAIARDHFGGDLTRLVDVGSASADKALSTVYQAFVCERGWVEFLTGIQKLHHLFYDQGRIEVVISGTHRGEIHHRDKPRYAEADLHVARGFYIKAAELHGLEGIACTFVRNDLGVDFTITWA